MKGVVFTEFYDFVEEHHSPAFLQETINEADLPHNGGYTATGTYDACEMASLVARFAAKSGTDIPSALRIFGTHLFHRFAIGFPELFEGKTSAFSFLESIDDHIHVEVQKLYPDAELPHIEIRQHTKESYSLIYTSSRHLGDFCEGLIRGCLDHFQEHATLTRCTLATSPAEVVEFIITTDIS